MINFYFFLVIAKVEDFRNRDTYPVVLQAFIELVFVGIPLCVSSVAHVYYLKSVSTPQFHDQYKMSILHCVLLFCYSHVNEITTPFTILALALQRFFKVCFPFQANKPEFSKYQLIANVVITGLPLLVVTADAVFIAYGYESAVSRFDFCYAGFFLNEDRRDLIGGIVFFMVPVAVSFCLYFAIGRGLMKMTTMQERNTQLTILFMVTCMLWLVFWLPERILSIYFHQTETLIGASKMFYITLSLKDFFTLFFSIIQPAILLLCYRPVQEPIVNLYKKIREKCGCSSSSSS